MIKSRKKHSRGNREFAAICRQNGFTPVCRHGKLENGELPGLSVEVRRTQRLHLEDALDDAAGNACGNIPILAHRKDHQPWKITLLLPDFLQLYRAYLQTGLPDPEPPASAAYPGSDPDSGRLPAENPAP